MLHFAYVHAICTRLLDCNESEPGDKANVHSATVACKSHCLVHRWMILSDNDRGTCVYSAASVCLEESLDHWADRMDLGHSLSLSTAAQWGYQNSRLQEQDLNPTGGWVISNQYVVLCQSEEELTDEVEQERSLFLLPSIMPSVLADLLCLFSNSADGTPPSP